jgi:hypothetical protein
MPFTLAHAVAVVPFHRRLGRRVPLSSLVVGSIAPDLAYESVRRRSLLEASGRSTPSGSRRGQRSDDTTEQGDGTGMTHETMASILLESAWVSRPR